jgi:hypothetical protein
MGGLKLPKLPTLKEWGNKPLKSFGQATRAVYDPLDLSGRILGGEKGPEQQVVQTDPQTSALIDERIKQSQRSPEEYQAEMNKDLSGGMATMQSDQSAAQETAQMGGDPSIMGGAIRSKFNQVASKDIQRLKDKNELQANLNKSQDMRKAWDMHMARQNIMTMNYEKLFKANSDAVKARSAVINQAAGVAGYAGGMWAANQNWSNNTGQAPMNNKDPLSWGGGGEGQGQGIDSSGLGWGAGG